jgi:hypothetical protein
MGNNVAGGALPAPASWPSLALLKSRPDLKSETRQDKVTNGPIGSVL